MKYSINFLNEHTIVFLFKRTKHMTPAVKAGKVIGDYRLITKIGRGGYSQIFYVQDIHTNIFYAMKIEKCTSEKKALHFEHRVFKKLEQSIYFPEFVKYGRTQDLRFLVMECFGPSIENLCQIHIDKHLSLSTSLRISIEMLRCIREFHNNGFIHRDIKPANFLVRKSKRYPLVLIDFGLSRPYINHEDGEMIPIRDRPGYVGTNKFASTNAYCMIELSQRDDLISWFYSIIKIRTSKLPWDNLEDKNMTYDMKINTSIEQLVRKMPRQFKNIYDIIISLAINETPNYDMIIALLVQAMEENGCSWNDPYDWELMSIQEIEKISIIPITPLEGADSPNIPMDLPAVRMISNDDHIPQQIVIEESSIEYRQNCCNIS